MLALLNICAASWSQTLYSENFDSGTPGQSLSAAPFNWTMYNGDLRIGHAPHGWTGNSIVGSLGPAGEQSSGFIGFSATPNKVITLSADVFVSDQFTGNALGLIDLPSGVPGYPGTGSIDISDNGTAFWELIYSTGPQDFDTWYAPSGRFINEAVHLTLSGDETTGGFWCSLTDSVGTVTSPTFIDPNAVLFNYLQVNSDLRYGGTHGLDADNLLIQASPSAVPEPCTTAIGFLAVVSLGQRRRCQDPRSSSG
jgi:hypothetical protein